MRTFLTVLVLSGMCTMVQAADSDVEGASDYPDIGRLERSTLKKYSQIDFDEYRIFTAPVKARKDRENYVTLAGRITRIAYFAPSGVSILEAQRNYENRLKESGSEIVFTCKSKECGGTNLAHSVEQYVGLDPFNMRYAVAEKSTPQSEIHVVVATSTDGSKIVKTQVIVIESASMESKMTDASTMEKAIVDSGSVALYGIYFDFGRSTLKPESTPTLQELAKLLQDDTSLQLIVVGHTDNIGEYDYNSSSSNCGTLSPLSAKPEERTEIYPSRTGFPGTHALFVPWRRWNRPAMGRHCASNPPCQDEKFLENPLAQINVNRA